VLSRASVVAFTSCGGIIRCLSICGDLYEYLERKEILLKLSKCLVLKLYNLSLNSERIEVCHFRTTETKHFHYCEYLNEKKMIYLSLKITKKEKRSKS